MVENFSRQNPEQETPQHHLASVVIERFLVKHRDLKMTRSDIILFKDPYKGSLFNSERTLEEFVMDELQMNESAEALSHFAQQELLQLLPEFADWKEVIEELSFNVFSPAEIQSFMERVYVPNKLSTQGPVEQDLQAELAGNITPAGYQTEYQERSSDVFDDLTEEARFSAQVMRNMILEEAQKSVTYDKKSDHPYCDPNSAKATGAYAFPIVSKREYRDQTDKKIIKYVFGLPLLVHWGEIYRPASVPKIAEDHLTRADFVVRVTDTDRNERLVKELLTNKQLRPLLLWYLAVVLLREFAQSRAELETLLEEVAHAKRKEKERSKKERVDAANEKVLLHFFDLIENISRANFFNIHVQVFKKNEKKTDSDFHLQEFPAGWDDEKRVIYLETLQQEWSDTADDLEHDGLLEFRLVPKKIFIHKKNGKLAFALEDDPDNWREVLPERVASFSVLLKAIQPFDEKEFISTEVLDLQMQEYVGAETLAEFTRLLNLRKQSLKEPIIVTISSTKATTGIYQHPRFRDESSHPEQN